MSKTILLLLVATLWAAGALGQSAETQANGRAEQHTSAETTKRRAQVSPSSSANTTGNASAQGVQAASQFAAGTTIQAQLAKPLDARKNKPDDEVMAKTTHEVKSEDRVVIPKGSKLVGHLTEVKAHSKDQATSELAIAFDRAVLKNGTQIPLVLSIQAIGRSQVSAAAMGEDTMASDNGGAMTPAGGQPSPSGGVVGGFRSTAAGAVNATERTAGGVVNSAGRAGDAVSGSLSATSRGVVGLDGLSLSTETSTSANASVISSQKGNVHLESGTEMVLVVK